jgi:hypothetical protein
MGTAVYEGLLANKYAQSYAMITTSTAEVETLVATAQQQEAASKEERSFFDSLNVIHTYEAYKRELKKSITAIVDTFNGMMDSIIEMITIFVINSVVVPFIWLWLLIYTFKNMLRRSLA